MSVRLRLSFGSLLSGLFDEGQGLWFFIKHLINMVPRPGIEPGRSFLRGILSPLRLPIPPPRLRFASEKSSSVEWGPPELVREEC